MLILLNSESVISPIISKGFLATQQSPKVWAVGGGKGGVGKSLVTANMSICLALLGYKVIAIDLDLGGANLHTCLGLNIPQKTLSDYLTGQVQDFSKLIIPTVIENLHIISGSQDNIGIANLKNIHKNKILSQIRSLDADYVLLDLGAGTTINTLDFFISSDKGILTTLPEPTSIENTYRFIKSVFHRKLKTTEEYFEIAPLVDQVMNSKIGIKIAPIDLINKITEKNEHIGYKIKNELKHLCLQLIVNQVRSHSDIEIGSSMEVICKKYFGINLNFAGHLEYDSFVWKSIKKGRPLITEFPNSTLINNFDKILHSLLEINTTNAS